MDYDCTSTLSEAHPETMDLLARAWCDFAVKEAFQPESQDQALVLHQYSISGFDDGSTSPNLMIGLIEEIQDTAQQISVQVQRLLDLKEKVRDRSNHHENRHSICMVPSYLRDVRPSCYTPRVVSIGPLHKDDENLKEFEYEKATCLQYVTDHSGSSPEQLLKACLQKVNDSIAEIRKCYAVMKTYNDDDLAEMMVIDAFFILGFFIQPSNLPKFAEGNVALQKSIFFDLLLLENQIPFFVLQDIYECTLPNSHDTNSKGTSLISIILGCFEDSSFFVPFGNDVINTTPDHLLGLLQNSLHPKSIMSSSDQSLQPTFNSALEFESFVKTHHPALELDKAGVKFKPNKDENWQMSMEFESTWFGCFSWWGWSNPTLRIPVMHISDLTEQSLRNLIAYEQCIAFVPYYVTSYVWAMDALVDTTEDLVKLVESKVIMNFLGSYEEATDIINSICKNVTFEEFYYKKQWRQLDQYYNGYWPRNIAALKRKYFSNPWTIIALVAAFILFGLSITESLQSRGTDPR